MRADGGSFSGRSLPDPGFPDDDGSAPRELREALGSGDPVRAVTALVGHRVLVPVVAVLGELEPSLSEAGLSREKSADMAVVTVRGPSGRLALPVFSSVSALSAWNPTARPVPVAGVLAARAAYDEGADTLLVDPAGPARVVLDGALLRALAEGRVPVPPAEDPEVQAAIESAARSVGLDVDQVSVEGAGAAAAFDLMVRLTVSAEASETRAVHDAEALGAALSADPVLRSRLQRGLDLELRKADAP